MAQLNTDLQKTFIKLLQYRTASHSRRHHSVKESVTVKSDLQENHVGNFFAKYRSWKMLEDFIKFLNKIKRSKFDDDKIDRLNSIYTPLVLAIMALLVASKQYVGNLVFIL